MKNIILGTAGHIDHGKTALVKALSGKDCDTHKEEKERGITINLGFSFLDLDDLKIGIIDVPGHKDFINTMVSGAFGIDIVILVVAADSGVMPQTLEHLKIIEVLGIRRGFVVITKVDLVEPGTLRIIKDEIKEMIDGTFLQSSPIIESSSKSGSGIGQIKSTLKNMSNDVSREEADTFFRMYIDRIFSVKGFGTVVNGSSLGGSVSPGDQLVLLPDNKKLKVRKIERYSRELKYVSGRSRLSLNLVGLNRDEFKRGMLVAEREILPTSMIDVWFETFEDELTIDKLRKAVILIGTQRCEARIRILNCLEGSKNRYIAQLRLSPEIVALRNDRFVMRRTSNDKTIGGGEIIDAYPLHHRRKRKKLADDLMKLSEGKFSDYLLNEIGKRMGLVSLSNLSSSLFRPEAEIVKMIKREDDPRIAVLNGGDDFYYLESTSAENLEKTIIDLLKKHHEKFPLETGGKSLKEISMAVPVTFGSTNRSLIELMLSWMLERRIIKQVDNSYALYDHDPILTEGDKKLIGRIEDIIYDSGIHPINMEGFDDMLKEDRIGLSKGNEILRLLLHRKKVYNIKGNLMHVDLVDRAREMLLRYLVSNREGITVAKFRDLIEGNRKISILMLNKFESEGIVERKDDLRIITQKGINLIEAEHTDIS
jgi:selenocysteine-specific elongation factor